MIPLGKVDLPHSTQGFSRSSPVASGTATVSVGVSISTKPRPPVDRGTYRRSFRVGKTPDGALVYNPLPYAAVIEFGRRAGSRPPPIDTIIEYAGKLPSPQCEIFIGTIGGQTARVAPDAMA